MPFDGYYRASSTQKRQSQRMPKDVKVKPRRAVVATVHVPGVSDIELESSLTELRELAKTLGYEVVQTFVQKRANFDATAYLGTGKREEIRRFVQGEPLEGEEAGEQDEAAPAPAKRRTGVGRAAAKTARHGLAAAKEDAKQAAATDEDKHRADLVLIDHEISLPRHATSRTRWVAR